MVVEYYKTPKGHCYKKNKDGSKRISKEDYNKAIKKGKEGGGSKKNKKVEKRTKVKIEIKYQKKTNKKGQKYYQKIDKNGKKIRISKNVYEKNALKGGVGEKRKTPNTNVNSIKDDTCWDAIMHEDINVIEYLNENPKNYVARTKMKDGTWKYECHNIEHDLKFLTTKYIYNFSNDVPYSKRGKPILNEFYICKKKLDEDTHLDRSKLKQNINLSDDTYIKLLPNLLLIKTPKWLINGKFPNLLHDIRQRIFNIFPTGTKANALVSLAMLFSTTPSSEVSFSGDHCNHKEPVSIYNFEPLIPHPRPSTPPPRPRPTASPPINRNLRVQPLPEVELNADGFRSRPRRIPRVSSTSTISSQGPSPLPPFLRSPTTSPTTSSSTSNPSPLPPFLRSPSTSSSTSNRNPIYRARRTNLPTRVARSGQSAYSTRPSTTTRPRTPTTPQSSSSNSQSSNDYNSNATTEEN